MTPQPGSPWWGRRRPCSSRRALDWRFPSCRSRTALTTRLPACLGVATTRLSAPPPVLRTDDRHRPGLALLIQYAAQLWEHVVPSVPIGRALGELAVAEFCSPEHAARHDDPRLPVELRRLLRWIDGHLADQITVAKLADIAGCSPTSVNRLFRRHLCAAPMDWVIARRVDRARELLSRTHLTVAEVAHQSGLTDPYYFSRLFKIRTGMPPREWRRQFSAP